MANFYPNNFHVTAYSMFTYNVFCLYNKFIVKHIPYLLQGVNFYTQLKTVTQMWRSDDADLSSKASPYAMPIMK